MTGFLALCGLLAALGTPATTSEDVPPAPVEEQDSAPAPPQSLTQTLQADAGVSIQTMCTNCNNADLSLAGLGNEHVKVSCDGVPVPAGLAQVYLLSIVPPSALDRVTVRKGPGDVELEGGAVGGGIAIERREPSPTLVLDAAADTGSYGWKGTRLDVARAWRRVGVSLVGSWAESDHVDGNGDANPDLPGFDRYTLDGRVSWTPREGTSVRLGAATYVESQTEGPAAFDWIGTLFSGRTLYNLENVDLDRQQVDARYEQELGGGARLALTTLWADRSQDIEETSTTATFGSPFTYDESYLIDERQRHAGVAWSRPLGAESILRAGVAGTWRDYGIVDIAFNARDDFLGDPIPADFALEETVVERGVWVEGESTLAGAAAVTVSAGLRWVDFDYDDNEAELAALDSSREVWLAIPLPDGHRVLPRAAVAWKPLDALQLRLSGGAGFRSPEPIFEEVCCGRRYRGNRGIPMERSRAIGLEATWQPGPRFKLAASTFVTDFRNLVVKLATLSYQFRPTYQNATVPEARHVALGLEGRVEATDWMTIKGAVSWLDAENRSAGDAIRALVDFNSTPVERVYASRRVPFLARRRAALGVDLRPGVRGLSVALSAQHTGELVTQRFDETQLDPQLGFAETPVFERTESFWVGNIGVNQRFRNGVSLFAGVDNVNDYVQADLGQKEFDYDWGPLRGRYYYGGVGFRLD